MKKDKWLKSDGIEGNLCFRRNKKRSVKDSPEQLLRKRTLLSAKIILFLNLYICSLKERTMFHQAHKNKTTTEGDSKFLKPTVMGCRKMKQPVHCIK
jgi:hypothetical protein